MKKLKLHITINKSAKDVFAFAINPENTPKWIDAIVIEQTNEWPLRVGTIYRNQNTAGRWREFEVTEYEPDKIFTLTSRDGYHVRYTCTPVDEHTTNLEYYEWVDEGDLHDILTIQTLEKLKTTIEAL